VPPLLLVLLPLLELDDDVPLVPLEEELLAVPLLDAPPLLEGAPLDPPDVLDPPPPSGEGTPTSFELHAKNDPKTKGKAAKINLELGMSASSSTKAIRRSRHVVPDFVARIQAHHLHDATCVSPCVRISWHGGRASIVQDATFG
jgi:hypothetical protein